MAGSQSIFTIGAMRGFERGFQRMIATAAAQAGCLRRFGTLKSLIFEGFIRSMVKKTSIPALFY
jgi:hypothetical protein